MTPQESELISDLFRRLREADTAPHDRDAEELIRRLIGEHPGAAYLLAQNVLVQEYALKNAQVRIEDLQRQLAEASQPTSFLGGLFGGGAPRRQAAPPPPPPPPSYGAGPWGAQPYPQQPGPWGAPQPTGGGFMQSAMATAVGVAGGALLFEGVEHMFGGGSAQAATFTQPPVVENTTINNYYGDQNYDSGSGGGGYDDGGSFFDDV